MREHPFAVIGILLFEIFSNLCIIMIFNHEDLLYPFRNDSAMTGFWKDVFSFKALIFLLIVCIVGLISSLCLCLVYSRRIKLAYQRNLILGFLVAFLLTMSCMKMLFVIFNFIDLLGISLSAEICSMNNNSSAKCYFIR
jgi:hypothetical protein